MPDRESRFRVIMEFLKQGDPAQMQKDLDGLNKAAQHVNQTTQQGAQATQQQAKAHQQAKPHVDAMAESLHEAANATYAFGMGAMYTGIPMLNFVANAGNMLNGLAMMGEGFKTLAANAPLLALTAVTVAVVGLATAMVAAGHAAEQFLTRIRDLSSVTGRSIGDTATMFTGLAGAIGGKNAGAAITSFNQGAASASITDMALEQSVARARPGGYMPGLSDSFAQYGLSRFTPGSTITNPQAKDTQQMMFDVAQDILRRSPAMGAKEVQALGPSFGAGGVEQLNEIIDLLKQGRDKGQTSQQVMAGFSARQQALWTPSEKDIQALSTYHVALNQLGLTFDSLMARVGNGLLPVFTAVIKSVDSFLVGVNQVFNAFDKVYGAIEPVIDSFTKFSGMGLGDLFQALGTLIGVGLVTAFVALRVVLIPVQVILAAIGAVFNAIGGAIRFVSPVLKPLIDGFLGIVTSLKSVDFPTWSQVIKSWGDKLGGVFNTVIGWIGGLVANLGKLPASIATDVKIAVGWASAEAQKLWAWLTTTAAPAITATVTGAWAWASAEAQKLWTWVASNAAPAITATVRGAWAWLSAEAQKLWTWIATVAAPFVTATISGAWNWLTSEAAAAYAWFTQGAIPAAAAAVSGAWNWVNDRAQAAYEWFTRAAIPASLATVNGAWNWLTQEAALAWRWFTGQIGAVRADIYAAWGWLSDEAGKAWRWFTQGAIPGVAVAIGAAWNWLSGEAGKAWNWLVGGLKTADVYIGAAFRWLDNIAQAVANWVGGGAAPLEKNIAISVQFLSGLAQQVIQWLMGAAQGIAINVNAALGGGTPGYATGGLVTVPTVASLAENGPEIVTPLGQVGRAAASLGGSTEVNVYVQGMDFSDPQAVGKIARAVGDNIVSNLRLRGMGRAN